MPDESVIKSRVWGFIKAFAFESIVPAYLDPAEHICRMINVQVDFIAGRQVKFLFSESKDTGLVPIETHIVN